MVVALLVPGVLAGIVGFVAALLSGAPLWVAMLVYTGVGSVTVLLTGMLLAVGCGAQRAALPDTHSPHPMPARGR
jgi:hypothetical protein